MDLNALPNNRSIEQPQPKNLDPSHEHPECAPWRLWAYSDPLVP